MVYLCILPLQHCLLILETTSHLWSQHYWYSCDGDSGAQVVFDVHFIAALLDSDVS